MLKSEVSFAFHHTKEGEWLISSNFLDSIQHGGGWEASFIRAKIVHEVFSDGWPRRTSATYAPTQSIKTLELVDPRWSNKTSDGHPFATALLQESARINQTIGELEKREAVAEQQDGVSQDVGHTLANLEEETGKEETESLVSFQLDKAQLYRSGIQCLETYSRYLHRFASTCEAEYRDLTHADNLSDYGCSEMGQYLLSLETSDRESLKGWMVQGLVTHYTKLRYTALWSISQAMLSLARTVGEKLAPIDPCYNNTIKSAIQQRDLTMESIKKYSGEIKSCRTEISRLCKLRGEDEDDILTFSLRQVVESLLQTGTDAVNEANTQMMQLLGLTNDQVEAMMTAEDGEADGKQPIGTAARTAASKAAEPSAAAKQLGTSEKSRVKQISGEDCEDNGNVTPLVDLEADLSLHDQANPHHRLASKDNDSGPEWQEVPLMTRSLGMTTSRKRASNQPSNSVYGQKGSRYNSIQNISKRLTDRIEWQRRPPRGTSKPTKPSKYNVGTPMALDPATGQYQMKKFELKEVQWPESPTDEERIENRDLYGVSFPDMGMILKDGDREGQSVSP